MMYLSKAAASGAAACILMLCISQIEASAAASGTTIIPNAGGSAAPSSDDLDKIEGEPLLPPVPSPKGDASGTGKGDPGADPNPQKIVAPDEKTPYRSAGKLTFVKDDGTPSFCTAQFVTRRVLLTAAHCVVNPASGAPYGSFLFWRAASGNDSKQKVGFECAAVYKEFTPKPNSPDLRYDYAFIRTNDDATEGVQSLVMATVVPVGAAEKIAAIGYPQNYDGGDYMYKAEGTWALAAAPGIVTMDGNTMQHGSSGGAWFRNFRPGQIGNDINVVVSLNSHAGPDAQKVNGPVIDNYALALRQTIVDGCPKG